MFATFEGAGGYVAQLLLSLLASPHDQIIITCLLMCARVGIEALSAADFFLIFLPD